MTGSRRAARQIPGATSPGGFYGWRIVAASSLAAALTAPGQTAAVSAFVDPMIADLRISRTGLSSAYLVGTLIGAAAMPLVGRALDRFGVRRVMALIGAVFGAFLLGLSTVSGIVGLTAGFVGIRMAGQGALSLVATTAVALWFVRRRGTAIGIVSAAGATGISLAPVLLERLVAAHGWRAVWAGEGLFVWATVIPLALLVFRDRPADLGQLPDGESPRVAPGGSAERPVDDPVIAPDSTADNTADSTAVSQVDDPMAATDVGPLSLAARPPGHGEPSGPQALPVSADEAELSVVDPPERSMTRAEAVRTRVFWLVAAAVATSGMLATAVAFHQISLLTERGLSPTAAAANFLPQTLAGLLASLTVGVLVDRFRPGAVLAGCMAALAGALGWATLVRPGLSAIGFGLLLGAAGGSIRTVEAATVARAFGTLHLGEIRGVITAVAVGSTAFGPVLFAVGRSATGSYREVLLGSAVLPLIVAALALRRSS